ncbi:MAG: hypothetical protein HZC37_29230 [Burkholderiales bacterium]|nr:hypothetical protein [Burkholderiales bacterium]
MTWLAAAAFVALPAAAQQPRNFPATALRGEIVLLQPPELLLNGRPARLSPGARIRGENNMMMVSGALANQRLLVHYTVDLSGLLGEVWVLTADERARQPWPTTREQAAAWTFDPVGQTWTRP